MANSARPPAGQVRGGEIDEPKDWARMRPYIFGQEVVR
jgi:hypothetical protein